MSRPSSFAVLLLCFFLSGAAGLLYQTAWTREFACVFGTSSLAVATVLAAYMAGLAAGAGLAARFAARIRRPVWVYGLLELGIAASALCLPLAVQASRGVYVALFGGQPDLPSAGGLLASLFQLVTSFGILMVPTAMMGATLPLLVRHAVRREREIGSRIGVLYGTNTAGAVAGTLVAAFVLLPALGLRPTVWVGAGLNLAVFLGAAWLSRAQGEDSAREPVAQVPSEAGHRWILVLIACSGVISFAYEVIWSRLLEHVLGSSLYAFATMLASFLTGIALGSALASRLATGRGRAATGFAIAQLGAAALSLAAFVGLDHVPDQLSALQRAGVDGQLADALVTMAVLLPGTLCIGATFPFAVRVLAVDERDAGPASARVFAANTLGSIVGALGTGFVVLPALGFVGALTVCAAGNLALAAAAGLLARPRRPRLAIASVAALALLVAMPPPAPWHVLRYAPLLGGKEEGEVVYFGVGRATTVLMLESEGRWFLRTGGLPEASIEPPHFRSSALVSHWLGVLPGLARPDASSMLVVGLGGGVALETVPASVERIDVVELEAEVVAANRAVAAGRARDPLSDPRVHVHVNDARNALLLTDRKFDAIVSQPSHPWSAGASHLYTREFFELAASRLSEDGVLVQWIGLGFVDEDLFRSLLASLTAVFPHVRVYSPPPTAGALFLASRAPLDVETTAARALAARPDELARFGLRVAEDLSASLMLDEAGARSLARGAEENRDADNRLQTESPRVVGRSVRGGVPALVAPLDPFRSTPASLDRSYLLRQMPAWRARALGDTFEDPLERRVLDAWIAIRQGRREEPRETLREVLSARPRHREARAALLLLAESAIARGLPPGSLVSEPLTPSERAVVEAWRQLGEDLAGVASLENELASVPVRDPLAQAAYRLRAEWRMHAGDAALRTQAIALADLALHAGGGLPRDLLLRARACAAAGESRAALHSLSLLAGSLDGGSARGRGLARLALDLARAIPPAGDIEGMRVDVERALAARARSRAR